MKKTITLCSVILSLLLITGKTVHAQNRTVATPTGTTATSESQVTVNKVTPEEANLQIREQRLLNSMTEEERILYHRKQILIDYENNEEALRSSNVITQPSVEEQRMDHLQQRQSYQEINDQSGKVEITQSKFNTLPLSRQKYIEENPDKYFINKSK